MVLFRGQKRDFSSMQTSVWPDPLLRPGRDARGGGPTAGEHGGSRDRAVSRTCDLGRAPGFEGPVRGVRLCCG